ncbi:hypothetical protein ABT56_01680 [Photobacterium aquae]|uniref:TadE-like domain-containing protein n=1 Tax=Photobacterium aquae TaxID=1195763 RepID=A0A0J1HBC5_9GAMM|nr:TadE family protein [Photobacterium aquae]KLV08941.1 hypothetical protein ABT56_01680 [Photobacterium aquae]
MVKEVAKKRALQKGVIAIEVSLCFLILVFTTFFIFEVCYQIFITTLTEHALRETVREAKQNILEPIQKGEPYNENNLFHDSIKKIFLDESSLWHFMIDKNNYDIQIDYFYSYPDFINDYQSQNLSSPLAEVTLTYQYQPMLSLSESSPSSIMRTVVVNLADSGRGK